MRKIINTEKMSEKEWQERRLNTIGGSDMGAIVGVNPYCSPIETWAKKTDPDFVTERTVAGIEQMYWGTTLEDIIGREFEKRMERKGEDFTVEPFHWIIGHDKYDFLTGNIDFRIVSKEHGYGVLECKNISDFSYQKWSKGDLPEYYIVQLQWYMGMMEYEYGYFAALIGGREWRCYRLDFDKELYDKLVEKAVDFFNNNIQGNVPPEILGLPSEADYLYGVVEKYTDMEEIGDDLEEHCIRYKEMSALRDIFKQEIEKEKNIIKVAVGKGAKAVANEWKISNGKRFTLTSPKHYIGTKFSFKDAENFVIRNLINTRRVVEYEQE